ncbi:MAG: mechanosensitive ion channel family protein [Rubritalea sp.]|uniref:mechanosensitive ion channel family protein n=1 Tax=Rubritalea sp. TaxID=2109375 RepID=UPI0032423F9B
MKHSLTIMALVVAIFLSATSELLYATESKVTKIEGVKKVEQAEVPRAVIANAESQMNSLHYVLTSDARGVDLPTSELKMMLRPLSREELEIELKEWMALLKQLISEASKTNLQIARMEPTELETKEGKELRDTQLLHRRNELVLVKHTRTVIDALEQKGGDVNDQRKYVNAVVVTKDVTNTSADQITAFAADFGVWFESREGGDRFFKKAAGFVAILIFFAILAKFAAVITRRFLRRQQRGSRMLRQFVQKTIGFVVFTIGVTVALSAMGVQVGTLLTAAGAGGLIIGFALQDSIANFASGIMIMFYKPFDMDDFVLIDGVKGKVEKMSFVSTTLVTIDNKELVIPNRKAWGGTITNYTGRAVRRVDFLFYISHGDDIERASALLIELVKGHESVLSKPEPIVGVNSLSDVAVEVFLRPWVKTDDYWPVYWELTKQVKVLFDKEGITIPKQQLLVHSAL